MALHKIVHDKGMYSLLVTIPENGELGTKCEQNRKRINAKLKHYALEEHSNDTLFLDLSTDMPLKSLSEGERDLYWDDAIHPSVLGYDKMAELMFQVVKKMYHGGEDTGAQLVDDIDNNNNNNNNSNNNNNNDSVESHRWSCAEAELREAVLSAFQWLH